MNSEYRVNYKVVTYVNKRTTGTVVTNNKANILGLDLLSSWIAYAHPTHLMFK